MSLLDVLYGHPAPRTTSGRVEMPLGPWPADASPQKIEAQRQNAIAGAARRRNKEKRA